MPAVHVELLVFFSINPCFCFAKVVKFSKKGKLLWIFLEIQSFWVIFTPLSRPFLLSPHYSKSFVQSLSIVVHIIYLSNLFHPSFFHLCNITVFISFIVSVLCCNILALNFSTPFAFLHPSFPLPLQQICEITNKNNTKTIHYD